MKLTDEKIAKLRAVEFFKNELVPDFVVTDEETAALVLAGIPTLLDRIAELEVAAEFDLKRKVFLQEVAQNWIDRAEAAEAEVSALKAKLEVVFPFQAPETNRPSLAGVLLRLFSVWLHRRMREAQEGPTMTPDEIRKLRAATPP